MPRKPQVKGRGKQRLTLEIGAAGKEQILRCQKLTNSPTITSVVYRAFQLLETIETMRAKGHEVILRHPEHGEQRLLIL